MARDLTEHDIVARIMRKENYLIGMLNKVRLVVAA
jgi:autophagy-related protein 9